MKLSWQRRRNLCTQKMYMCIPYAQTALSFVVCMNEIYEYINYMYAHLLSPHSVSMFLPLPYCLLLSREPDTIWAIHEEAMARERVSCTCLIVSPYTYILHTWSLYADRHFILYDISNNDYLVSLSLCLAFYFFSILPPARMLLRALFWFWRFAIIILKSCLNEASREKHAHKCKYLSHEIGQPSKCQSKCETLCDDNITYMIGINDTIAMRVSAKICSSNDLWTIFRLFM